MLFSFSRFFAPSYRNKTGAGVTRVLCEDVTDCLNSASEIGVAWKRFFAQSDRPKPLVGDEANAKPANSC